MLTKSFKCPLTISIALVMLTAVANVHAYRTDHGFLPPGANVCEFHVPVTLEIPKNAQAEPDPFKGEFSHGFYHIEELGRGLFYMTDGVYQAMFLVSKQGIIVVDAPPSIGVNQVDSSQSISIVDVIYSIPETQGLPIKRLIYSHTHMDHIGAASIIQDAFPKVKIIAHWQTKQQLRLGTGEFEGLLPGSGSNPPPLPTQIFFRERRVNLGKQYLHLSYKGPAHEPGNIYIYAPKQKVLMLVDVIFPGWSPFTNLAIVEDVPEYIEAYDEVLEYDFDVFVGGHYNRLGKRSDVIEARTYIMDIKANALAALQNPALFQIFGILPQNGLGAFSIYLDQMACDCANRTLDPSVTPSGKNWLIRLGNADINTLTHCWEMGEAIRIDPTF